MEAAKLYRPGYGYGGFRGQRLLEPRNTHILFQESVPSYWLLRFFIPPAAKGMTSFNLTCPQNAVIGVAARLGIPPQGESYTTSHPFDDVYIAYPWQRRSGTMQELRNQDWLVQNEGGTISIMADFDSGSPGEWIFVKVIFNGKNPGNLGANLNNQVDLVAYKQWYETMQWEADGNPPLDVVSIPAPPIYVPPTTKPTPTQGEPIMPIQELTAQWPTLQKPNLTPEQIQAMKDNLLAQLLGAVPEVTKVEPEEPQGKKAIITIYDDGTWVAA